MLVDSGILCHELGMRKYFGRWVWRAISGSLGLADLLASIIASAIAIAIHFWPNAQPAVNSLIWQVPVWALVITMLARLIMAPAWLAKEDAVKIAQLEAKLSDRADLEVKFDSTEQYRQIIQGQAYWLFRVHNHGPSVAENVMAELCSIIPAPTPTAGLLSYPITPSNLAVDSIDCHINPGSHAQFRIARTSVGSASDIWLITDIGGGGGFSASFNLVSGSTLEMNYRVHAANAEERLFTLQVIADGSGVTMVKK
jgi:hypothetical protein